MCTHFLAVAETDQLPLLARHCRARKRFPRRLWEEEQTRLNKALVARFEPLQTFTEARGAPLARHEFEPNGGRGAP